LSGTNPHSTRKTSLRILGISDFKQNLRGVLLYQYKKNNSIFLTFYDVRDIIGIVLICKIQKCEIQNIANE